MRKVDSQKKERQLAEEEKTDRKLRTKIGMGEAKKESLKKVEEKSMTEP